MSTTLIAPPPTPAKTAPPLELCPSATHPDTACRLARSSIGEVMEEIRSWSGKTQSPRTRGAQRLLDYMTGLAGDTWPARWLSLETATAGGDWRTMINGDDNRTTRRLHLTAGLGALMLLDVVRPNYQWLHGRRFDIYHPLTYHRDQAGSAAFVTELDTNGMVVEYSRQVVNTIAQIQAHTGKAIQQISVDDLLELLDVQAKIGKKFHGLQAIWRTLHRLGWIPADRPTAPVRRTPQLSVDAMVDFYHVPNPWREPLIEYLRTRSASLDYNTLRTMAGILVATFWRDILNHHPDVDRFKITRDIAEAWKQRVFNAATSELRSQYWQTMFYVRAFYNDINSWAIHDAFWVPWTAPCPVSREDIRGYQKHRRRQISNMQQRTRHIAPLVPQFADWITTRRRETADTLARVRQLAPGDQLSLDGQSWTIYQRHPRSPIRLRNGDSERLPAEEEEQAFWTWAVVETMRQTGLRVEEIVELTHFAIQPYKDPTSGDTIPLIHVVPSKTDQERLVVAGPELVHVIAEIINRVRDGAEQVPLTERWDAYEHQLSPPLPHLFAKPFKKELRVISIATIRNMINKASRDAELNVHGELVIFNAHDFRRVFATDALSSGLPPHIVQVLMGHKSLATTQGYAAIYPQDVIRHHRTHIARRRQARPSEEYREPTAAEWEEFEAHFVKRKVSLGSCGRAYGTNCQHEHACLRCSLLRPDPAQLDRIEEIIHNLHDRIEEAEQKGWLGEIDGLKISLDGARDKHARMFRDADRAGQMILDIPAVPKRHTTKRTP